MIRFQPVLIRTQKQAADDAAAVAAHAAAREAAERDEREAQHPDARVRVAAAGGLRNLPEQDVEPHIDGLLQDSDVGVRKVALQSAAAFDSPAMITRVQRLGERDPEPAMRDLAKRARNR